MCEICKDHTVDCLEPNPDEDKAELALMKLLNGRCILCSHWQGDRIEAMGQIMLKADDRDLDMFLIAPYTFPLDGICPRLNAELSLYSELSDEGKAETPSVFGCILYEGISLKENQNDCKR